MRKLFIFCIFISLSCQKEHDKPLYCFDMTIISDALPIQFWLNGQQTFNEYIPGYPIIHQCFTQEFQCDDNIKLQLQDDKNSDYFLSFIDDSNDTINYLPFVETAQDITIVDSHFTSDLQGMTNISGDDPIKVNNWSWSSSPSPGVATVSVSKNLSVIANSKILVKNVSGIVGPNTVSFKWQFVSEGSSSVFTLKLFLLKFGAIVQAITLENKTGILGTYTNEILDFAYSASQDFDQIGFGIEFSSTVDHVGGTVNVFYLTDISIQPSVYDLSFVPSNIGICEQSTQLFLSKGGTAGDINYPTPVNTWVNLPFGGLPNWTIDSGGAHASLITGQNTCNVSIPVSSFVPGDVVRVFIELDANLSASVAHLTAAFYNGGGGLASNNINPSATLFTNFITADFTMIGISNPTELRILMTLGSAPSTPINYTIKNNLRIYKPAGAIVAKSDFINFSDDIVENTLIRYKSNQNFEGLVYPGDGNYFSIRVPGVFFHQSFPTTVKSIDIGNAREINTASLEFRAKELSVQDCPYFMHDKILLILQHAISGSVVINNVEWSFDNQYALVDDEQQYIFRRASTKLVRRNRVTRNII